VGFEGLNREESPSRGVGNRKRWLQPGERRSQTGPVGSPNLTNLGTGSAWCAFHARKKPADYGPLSRWLCCLLANGPLDRPETAARSDAVKGPCQSGG